MKSEERPVAWKCGECSKEFKYESEKRRHEQSHAPQFECKVCSKKFSFLSALRRHEKQHERKGSAHCDECGGKFRDDTLLKRHMQYAHKGTFTCAECKATFSSQLALRTHLKTHKPESEREYRCSYDGCNKTFNFPHHLKHHELTHTDSKQHFCKECGKGFIQSYHLKIHHRLHEPATWLSCTVLNCTKRFTNEYALKRHLATHKKFKTEVKEMRLCKSCNELFSRRMYKTHAATCIAYEDTKEFNTALENLQIDEIISVTDVKFDNIEDIEKKDDVDVDSNEVDNIEDHVDVDINEIDNVVSPVVDCKAALGGCIVTGSSETNNDCLCAQISDPSHNKCKSNGPIASTAIMLPKDDLECIEKRKGDANACDSCVCASICAIKNNIDEMVQEIPEFESRNDGIIKIKETFDIDIVELKNVDVNRDIEDKMYLNDFGNPINTCKDVLGKCIVSGNGTIGEGCLCAKMIADNQQMNAQEIEDITPCPKNTWLSQHL